MAYAFAVGWVLHRPPASRRTLGGILGAALLFRLLLVPSAPTLSTDLYRYLWDGRLAVAGVSPYRHPPSAPEVAGFRDALVYPQLNHVHWRTIYPPGGQLVFAALAGLRLSSVIGMKLVILAADLTGPNAPLWILAGLALCAGLVALGIRETAPRIAGRVSIAGERM